MNKKFVFLCIFCFVLLSSSVFGAPPPFQSSSYTDLSWDIIVPKSAYVIQNTNFIFYIHVFNSSGYPITGDHGSCYLNIYNKTGDHIFEEEMIFNDSGMDNDFVSYINSSLTSEIRYLPYIVWCNNSVKGGYYSGVLEINTVSPLIDNTEIHLINSWSDNIQAIVIVSVCLIVVLMILGYIAFRNSALNMDKTLFWFSIICFGIALTEIVFMLGIVYFNEAGGSPAILSLLMINFYALGLVSFGIGMSTIFMIIMNIFRAESWKNNWKGKW